ncbi:FAD binding domain protein [Aspergillus steynii IBT 23096]|uniref:FAD binding domain protein n=1 Tax=Aspergillus steynii IBT 23096 TaxID=1392250 RepID=A0A2I2FVE9_9EURO|nr:FAD binding domain protein [Aspergillus steynii IBT 23096]PLB44623.1 FAD binding domain protein [Aspergillus steynii IBT 23096]
MQIIWRDNADAQVYETARLDNVFNKHSPNRFPLAIVKVTSENDVIAAVQLAIQHKCQVSVRAGGHSFPVWSVQDDSILVDMGDWKQVKIDPEKSAATVTPSVTSKELNDRLALHGLMFPGGHCGDVGLGGFLLQGGMGWNCGNWGWGCEFVEAVDVVTAQGQLVHCSAQQNEDLFWASRGAGPAFPGLITQFHVRLIPLPLEIHSSMYIYPQNLYYEAFNWALALAPTLDGDTEITAKAKCDEGKPVFAIYFTSMKDTEADARAALQHVQNSRPAGALTESFCYKDSLGKLYEVMSTLHPKNHRYLSDNVYLKNDADVPGLLEKACFTLPHQKSYLFWTSMRPWSRKKLPEMALSMRSDHYFAVYLIWEKEEDDRRCREWLQQVMKKVEVESVGSYIGDSDFELRLTEYWTVDNAQRLTKIRDERDPDGRINGGFPAASKRSVSRQG